MLDCLQFRDYCANQQDKGGFELYTFFFCRDEQLLVGMGLDTKTLKRLQAYSQSDGFYRGWKQ